MIKLLSILTSIILSANIFASNQTLSEKYQILYFVKANRAKFAKTPALYNKVFKKLFNSKKISTLCVTDAYPINHKDPRWVGKFLQVIESSKKNDSVIALNAGAPFKGIMLNYIGQQPYKCSSIAIKQKNQFVCAVNDGEIFWHYLKKRYQIPPRPKIVIIGANGSCTSAIANYTRYMEPSEITLVDVSFNNLCHEELTSLNVNFLLPDKQGGKKNSLHLHKLIAEADLIINGSGIGRRIAILKDEHVEYSPLSEKFCPLTFKQNALIIDLDYDLFKGNLLEQARQKNPSVRTENGAAFMIYLNSYAILAIAKSLGFAISKDNVIQLVKDELGKFINS